MTQIIDEMPTVREVERAEPRQLVSWYLFLRPTMSNEELEIVKLIARRVEQIDQSVRQRIQAELRR